MLYIFCAEKMLTIIYSTGLFIEVFLTVPVFKVFLNLENLHAENILLSGYDR